MVANVAIDSVVGVVPLAGDFFDARWKSNTRNMRLLDRHLANPAAARRSSRRFVVAALVGIGVLAVGLIALVVFLGSLLSHRIARTF